MRALGIVRKVDELGRIVIPIELRRTMNIQAGTPLEVFVENDYIIYRKYNGKSKNEIKNEIKTYLENNELEKALTLIDEFL